MAALFALFALVLSVLSGGSGRAVEKTTRQKGSAMTCTSKGVCVPHEPVIIVVD